VLAYRRVRQRLAAGAVDQAANGSD
jgi:hypothetical protein